MFIVIIELKELDQSTSFIIVVMDYAIMVMNKYASNQSTIITIPHLLISIVENYSFEEFNDFIAIDNSMVDEFMIHSDVRDKMTKLIYSSSIVRGFITVVKIKNG